MPVPSPPRSSSAAPHTPSQTHKAAVPGGNSSLFNLQKIISFANLPQESSSTAAIVLLGLGLMELGNVAAILGQVYRSTAPAAYLGAGVALLLQLCSWASLALFVNCSLGASLHWWCSDGYRAMIALSNGTLSSAGMMFMYILIILRVRTFPFVSQSLTITKS